MVQFRRLDPLANASPYQRLAKSPVKSYTLTEAQYDYVSKERPDLLITFIDSAVIGVPNRDYLEVHYAYQEVEHFRDNFVEMFKAVVAHSSKEEAPRGVLLSFRDRPNRASAQTLFWGLALEEGPQWVEMSLTAVPEQDEPSNDLGNGYSVRELTDADAETLANLEAEISGKPRLSERGLATLRENARWFYLVLDGSGKAVGYLSFTTQPGGWATIQSCETLASVAEALRKPLLDWSIGFLRNHGGRRIRRTVYTDAVEDVKLLREAGFTPGETGLDYTRSVDPEEIKAKLDERASHGTLIKFGDWR